MKGLRADIPASKIALIDHLKREPYYLGFKNSRINGSDPRHCFRLDPNHHKFPESLKSLIESAQTLRLVPDEGLRYGSDN